MKTPEPSHILALTFSGELEQEFSRLRAEYRHYVDYDIVPHMTLAFPFTPRGNIHTIIGPLDAYAGITNPFTVIMDRTACFTGANNGVYVTVRDPREIRMLNIGIIGMLEGLVYKFYADYDYSSFVPHMTIAEKIPEEAFPVIRRKFAGMIFNRKVVIRDFNLFIKEGRMYRKEREFRFGGGQ